VAIELQRTAHKHDHYPLRWEAIFSAIRALAFGAGLHRRLGLPFAAAFAVLITAGQVFAYTQGMRPGLDYEAARRHRLTRHHIWGAIARTAGYIATALICSAVVRHVEHPWQFALRVGLVTAAGSTVNPCIEYCADNLPERRLGVFGIWLVLSGFAMQSVQYWLAIFNVRVT
jgi:hypothetical protein